MVSERPIVHAVIFIISVVQSVPDLIIYRTK